MTSSQNLIDSLQPLFVDKEAGNKYWKGVIYGWPGAGKTVLACSVGNSVLHIACDPEGYDSLENHPDIWARVQPMEYRGLTQFDALVKALSDGPLAGQYDHLVVDTYSSALDLDLQRIYAKRMATENIKPDDWKSPEWDDYYPSQSRGEARLQKLFYLPMHVTLVAHAQFITIKGRRTDMMRPSFRPQMWNIVSKWTKNCYYLEKEMDYQSKKITRYLQTDGDGVIEAKTRIKLPLRIKEPNLREIVETWMESNRG